MGWLQQLGLRGEDPLVDLARVLAPHYPHLDAALVAARDTQGESPAALWEALVARDLAPPSWESGPQPRVFHDAGGVACEAPGRVACVAIAAVGAATILTAEAAARAYWAAYRLPHDGVMRWVVMSPPDTAMHARYWRDYVRSSHWQRLEFAAGAAALADVLRTGCAPCWRAGRPEDALRMILPAPPEASR